MPTPHIEAKEGEIAPIVITAGDPKRCEYIAKKYLNNPKLVNTTRGMNAYTGKYKNKEITIFPVGMGMASMGIYAYELFNFYNVNTIIRIGTSGSLNKTIKIFDTILLEGSYTESNFAFAVNRDNNTHLAYSSNKINSLIESSAKSQNIKYIKGYGLCNEFFDAYLNEQNFQNLIDSLPKDITILTSEMEAFALFYIAKMLEKEAACLLTVVDSKYQKDIVVTSEEREKNLNNMILLALETCLKI